MSIRMSKQARSFFEQKTRRRWFYYHLKNDSDFKREVIELKNKIAIKTPNGLTYPELITDFKLYGDPDHKSKSEVVEAFIARWNVVWDYDLLRFLIWEDEVLPPMSKGMFVLGVNDEKNMFEVQIPVSVQREELEFLWRMLRDFKEQLGIDVNKKPRKNTHTELATKAAYDAWKTLRTGKSWTTVSKAMSKTLCKYMDITAAKRHLKAHGYSWGVSSDPPNSATDL